MTKRLRGMLGGARALESRLAAAFETAAQAMVRPGGARALEVVELASDEIARHVQPAGRGRYVFPFNIVSITFTAPDSEQQAQLAAICDGPPSIAERIHRRLASAGCDAPDVDVSVSYAAAPNPAWTRPEFHIALSRIDPSTRAPRGPALRVELIVTHGNADRGAYSFTTLPIAIGRGAEVRDSRHQLLRLNHVAFTEGRDEITQSVSRRHARIELDRATDRPRVIDDNSAQGTSVIRNGQGLPVPRGSRGLGLQSGDEIVLGQARVRVIIS
jgi:hypothetical protein